MKSAKSQKVEVKGGYNSFVDNIKSLDKFG